MSTSVLSNADLAATTELAARRRANTTVADAMAELFGDSFARALHRETRWNVPDSERTTCPVHDDWRSHCWHLHLAQAA
ncbi:hypothetical protein ACIQMV_08680 [Streptomyces sp. NPDC091412]|uniref:hypothetical protein n=1 Tax=Streptomyces sp. NPDC091412 TaxID=3366002 RepID=UPI00380D88A5